MTLRIGVDVGGTFTDFVAYDTQTGALHEHKLLTTPQDPAAAILQGIREMLANGGYEPEAVAEAEILHGTTLVTNALIERKGRPIALLVTEGARDVIETGRENRYDPYDRMLVRPAPLVPRGLRREISERMIAGGKVHRPLDRDQAARALHGLAAEGVEAVAVSFLHSYVNPAHERAVREIAESLGLRLYLSLSSDVAPEIGELERTMTTAANAYIQPIVDSYLRNLLEQLRRVGHRGRFFLMWSDGGLASVESTLRAPVRLLESGPAAGALAAGHFAARMAFDRVIAFDMGGTTAKICLVRDARPSRTDSFEVGRVHLNKHGSGTPLRVPSIHMLEIGAGGGSLAQIDSLGLLKVGPQSAGANPGPACYGLGGAEATVTDANLLLGYLSPDKSLAGGVTIDVDRARAAFAALGERLEMPADEVAFGARRIVTENMAQAVKLHVTERGEDPREYTLMAFGGAAPLHAYDVAQSLGIRRVVIPRGAGVLSAFGFLTAHIGLELVQTFIGSLKTLDTAALRATLLDLRARAVEALASAGVAEDQGRFQFILDMRYQGQGYEIQVPLGATIDVEPERLATAFTKAYEERYGVVHDGTHEIRACRLRAEGPDPRMRSREADLPSGKSATARRRIWVSERSDWVEATVMPMTAVRPGKTYAGPLLVEGDHTTVVVGPTGTLTADAHGELIMDIPRPAAAALKDTGAKLDPVDLEIILARLRSIADEADIALLRTAFSSVVRDGKDYSLIISDTKGNCLALPTECMPLFVTTLPRTVSILVEKFPIDTLSPGDILITNNPWYCAGHKSDVTLVSPVYHNGKAVAFVGTILHLPDIGGVIGDFRAWDVFEEGLMIPPLKLYEAGKPNEAVFSILRENVRVPEHVLGDIASMRAAIVIATRRLLETLQDAPNLDLNAVSDEINWRVREAFLEKLRAIPKGRYHAVVTTDGIIHGDEDARRPIHFEATIDVTNDGLKIDYTGTERQRPRQPINCPIPYTISDTIYSLQYMLNPGIPNVGPQFSPVQIVAPEGCILNAVPPVPVYARTRTGLNIATLLYSALADAAPDLVQAGCGHNVIFNLHMTHEDGSYADLSMMPKGGMGATGGRDGWDVTVFPTNCTMISTEVGESKLPILMSREMVCDSGGPGRERGGVGQKVTIHSLADRPLTGAFRLNFHEHPPIGLRGGLNGGAAYVTINGAKPVTDPVLIQPGGWLEVLTAGGGGMGDPKERDPKLVLSDVDAGLVSRNAAREIYGVAVDARGKLDEQGTHRLRQKRDQVHA